MKHENEIFEKLLKFSQKAARKNQVPIAAAVVDENRQIIGLGSNKTNKKIITSHAEILALNAACKKLKTNKLNNCSIWITVEPCMMCLGAFFNAGIRHICYFLENEKSGFIKSNHTFDLSKMSIHKVKDPEKNNQVKKIMKDFFKKLR
ncbi:deaminase [Spiroplasma eriocheiris]|uniref:tRNA-specific adenosine deaminase n=1 Tax=Spiroplasma eriocheiris TaxID=315358 RepID=A0A0H3XJX5_9MOLU|nr:deaminase [Spiroplasma eriocheiris]AHF57146.1 putative Cytidine and Deoxycytidylate deaminase [Spiroplasma eriocheiris CCTCC M 207170]AKM53614.1 tRNA-specific adenosine deaminase [Spiroplasma eriocheiris]